MKGKLENGECSSVSNGIKKEINHNGTNGNSSDCDDCEPGPSGGSGDGMSRQGVKKRQLQTAKEAEEKRKKSRLSQGSNEKTQPDIKSMFARGSNKNKRKSVQVENGDSENGTAEDCSHDDKKTKVEISEEEDAKTTKNCDEAKLVVPKVEEKMSMVRCKECRQLLNDPELKLFPGDSEDAVEEFIALTDSRLSLFTGNEEEINEADERPQHKITNFSVYDKSTHLCPFDTGLVEKNVELYFSGYVKPIYDENPGNEGLFVILIIKIC